MKEFFRNVITILRGTAIAQVVLILALPLLTRLYPPTAFGTAQAIQSFLTFLLVASCLRLEIAILSVPENELPELLRSCFWICVITNALVLVIVAMVIVGAGKKVQHLTPALWFLPLLSLVAGWGLVLSYLALRLKAFRESANAKIQQTVFYVVACVLLAPVLPSATGLVSGDLVGKAASCWRLAKSLRLPTERATRRVREAIYSSVGAHRPLVFVSLPGALINVLASSYTPVLMLFAFNASIAGQFALVERVVGAPIAMVGGAASQVFMAGFGDAVRQERSARKDLFRALVLNQLKLGVLPAILLMILAPFVFPFIFGNSWGQAGRFTQALVPLFLLSFAVMPVNMALTVAGHQRVQLLFDVSRLLVTAATWGVIAALKIAPLPAVWIYGASASMMMIAYLLVADRALAEDDRNEPARATAARA